MRFFETNVLSGVRLARHYTPKMAKRGWGRVVFIRLPGGNAALPNMDRISPGKPPGVKLPGAISRSLRSPGL